MIIIYCEEDGYRLPDDSVAQAKCPHCGRQMHYIAGMPGEDQKVQRIWERTADEIIRRRGRLETGPE